MVVAENALLLAAAFSPARLRRARDRAGRRRARRPNAADKRRRAAPVRGLCDGFAVVHRRYARIALREPLLE